MTFYLCNGKKNCLNKENGCYINGGDCKHTLSPLFSIYGECKDPENHPERFDVTSYAHGNVTQYVEKEDYHG